MKTKRQQTDPNPHDTTTDPNAFVTFLIVAGCAIFFCSKGVFIKSAYGLGADPITVLTLRMAYALPVFVLVGWLAGRRSGVRLTRSQWLQVALLGFIGYYLSAILNFTGLQYVSLGLERMVLYSYPSLVLLGSAIFLRKKVSGTTIFSMLLAYAGIAVAYAGETGSTESDRGHVLLGAGLVFASAVTYAIFVVGGGKLLKEMGAARFTACVVGFSCVFMIAHYVVVNEPGELADLPSAVHGHALLLALFGTLIPSFLLGVGLKRAGAQKFAIIGTVGPLATIVLAWLILGEVMNAAQIVGFVLTMAGGLAVSLLKERKPPAPRPLRAEVVTSSRQYDTVAK